LKGSGHAQSVGDDVIDGTGDDVMVQDDPPALTVDVVVSLLRLPNRSTTSVLSIIAPEDHLRIPPLRGDLQDLVVVPPKGRSEVLGLETEDLGHGVFDPVEFVVELVPGQGGQIFMRPRMTPDRMPSRGHSFQIISIIINTPIILPIDEERSLIIPQRIQEVVIVLKGAIVKGDSDLSLSVTVPDCPYGPFAESRWDGGCGEGESGSEGEEGDEGDERGEHGKNRLGLGRKVDSRSDKIMRNRVSRS